jgi:transposase, IS6 family
MNAAYPIAPTALERDGECWRLAKFRQVKFLDNIVAQDHRRIRRLVWPGLDFKSFVTASRTVVGYGVMAMIPKGQVVSAPANDLQAQSDFIAPLFRVHA